MSAGAKKIWPLLLALIVALSGCYGAVNEPPSPTPTPTAVPYAPIGDAASVRTIPAVLYYLSADLTRLIPTLRPEIEIMPGETVVYALLGELLREPDDPSISPLFPAESGVYILDVEQSQDVVTVNLSGNSFFSIDPFRLFAARAAITNTLSEMRGIRYVNVLADGQEMPLSTLPTQPYGIPLPTGAITRVGEDLSAEWIEREGEYNRLMQAADPLAAPIRRMVTLYFSSPDGKLLLPEIREIEVRCGDMVTPVIEELVRGPGDPASLMPTMPAGLRLISCYAERSFDGRIRCLELNFSNHLDQFISQSGMSEEIIYASLVRTLTAFIPKLEGIRISISGRVVKRVGNVTFNEDIMTRSSFPMQVGRTIELYFPRSDGRLRYATRALPQREAGQVRKWLEELIKGPQDGGIDDPLIVPFPDGFNVGDIKGIAFNSDVAIINVSREGADKLSAMEPLWERAVIFALINTVAGAPGVNWVRILVEERPISTLSGSISLKEALFEHHGIVVTTKEEDTQ